MGRGIVGRGGLHGSEFVEVEQTFLLPYPLLGEEGGALIVYFDDQNQKQKRQQQYQNTTKRQTHVKKSLYKMLIHTFTLCRILRGQF